MIEGLVGIETEMEPGPGQECVVTGEVSPWEAVSGVWTFRSVMLGGIPDFEGRDTEAGGS